MLNTHTLVKNLVSTGLAETTAAVIISDAILSSTKEHTENLEKEHVKIKTDLEIISRTTATKTDIVEMKSELRSEMSEMKSEMATKTDLMRVEVAIRKDMGEQISQSKTDIQKWMVGLFAMTIISMVGLYLKH